MSDPKKNLFHRHHNTLDTFFRRRRVGGGLRLSSQELDGCDFVSEVEAFDSPPSRVVNNIQVTVNLEVCGCKGGKGEMDREQSERVANILTRVVKGGGGLVVCKQVDWSEIKN